MIETRAAVAWKAQAPLVVEKIRIDGPKAGEVLVEIFATGICHTDAYTLSGLDSEGKFPCILGHEGAGIVREVGAGVQISSINIESVKPPPETEDAFRDVASARADLSRIVSQAEGYANDVVPKARGEAQQLLENAAGYKQRKINEATGDAERFNQVAAEYAKASQVNGSRLYLETMEQILPRIKKMFVDRNGNLDLTIIRKGEAPK